MLAASSDAVMTMFGQALSAHCPDQLSCGVDRNGKRYGIGH